MLVGLGGRRIAVELKYLLSRFDGTVDGEAFDLPNQAAQDISRHDVVKDIVRVETLISGGYAGHGLVVVLTNDATYWRPSARATTIDAAFRIHQGRTLKGTLAWAATAGRGTTTGRDAPLVLSGTYTCTWRNYSQVSNRTGRATPFRYLLLPVTGPVTRSPTSSPPSSRPTLPVPVADPQPIPPGRTTAREEILAIARDLARRSTDGTFTLSEIITPMRTAGSRFAESTIRTHVTSRMCADAPDHHATTFDDFQRLGTGRYRLRKPLQRSPT